MSGEMRAIFSTACSPSSPSICFSLARPRWYRASSGIEAPFLTREAPLTADFAPAARTSLFQRMTALLWRAEAVRGNHIGAGGVGIGVLVFRAHGDALAPELAKLARARQQISEGRIQIEHIHAARPGFGGPLQALDQVLDHFPLERIIEINQERRARPSKIEDVLMDHANVQARAMFLLPLVDILGGGLRQFLV